MEFLFDPKNPNNPTKHFSFTESTTDYKTSNLTRFQPAREIITDRIAAIRSVAENTRRDVADIEILGNRSGQEGATWQLRFEQMICQINYNCSILFQLNPDLCFNAGCTRRRDKWVASTIQTVDIEIFEAVWLNEDEETFEDMTRSEALRVDSIPVGSTKRRNLEALPNILDKDGALQYYVARAKRGVAGIPRIECTREQVHIIKVGIPQHFTLALYYPEANRVEFFDSGGSWGAIVYEGDNPISATLKQLRKTRSHAPTQPCLLKYDLDHAVCQTFQHLYPGNEFVSINTKNLQILDKDAYCQSWVLLYVYMRFIYSQIDPDFNTTKKCLEFLQRKTPLQLFELVLGWWKYIIYLPTNIIKSPRFKEEFVRISGGDGRAAAGVGRGDGRAAAGAGRGDGGMHGGNIINNEREERPCIIM